MGSFLGHVLPGTFFLIFGIWWAVKHSYRHFTASKQKPRRTERWRANTDLIEGVVKIACATVGFILEQVTNDGPMFRLTNPENPQHYQDGNNWSHCTMYMFFIFSGIADILVISFPLHILKGTQHFFLALALTIEGYLFYFHTHGRPPLDTRLHTLLILAIWTSAMAVFILCTMEALKPSGLLKNIERNKNYLLLDENASNETILDDEEETELCNSQDGDHVPLNGNIARTTIDHFFKLMQQHNSEKSINTSLPTMLHLIVTTGTILQGTWFWQIAFILYPPNVTPWDGKSAANVEFATVFFAWHLASALTFVSVVYFLTCKYIRRA